MNSDFDPKELHVLFAELSDDKLSPEKHDRLETLLKDSPQARKQWFLFCDVETGLKDWAATEEERQKIVLPATTDNAVRLRRAPRLGLFALVATALIAITLTIWWNRPGTQPTAAEAPRSETRVSDVAVLTHAVNAEWDDDAGLAVGATIAPSMIHLRSGALLIEFFSGASLVLEGPASFEILATNEGRLQSGKLNAHVPPQATGFTVRTPVGDVVDHGTDFGVALTDDRPHEVHVFSGKVEVNSESGSLDVRTGEAIRLGADGIGPFDADRSAFLVEQELIEQSRLASDRRLAQWRDASSRLSSDEATLCHLRFAEPIDGVVGYPRGVVDSATDSQPRSGGSVVGSQWTEGRWRGKGGILFRSPGDRVRMTVSVPMKTMTLLAWVNVQSLSRWHNSLLSADSDAPGSVRWLLTKRGQLRLEIARDLGRPRSDWEAVESQPFLTEDRQRRWIMLATTFDGTTVRHYADGRLVGTGASFTPESLHLGTAELGNWSGSTRRDLHAILDEFAVLGRVMSEKELAEIHGYGKP